MKTTLTFLTALLLALPAMIGVQGASAANPSGTRLTPVPIQQVVIEDAFWSPKIKTWREVTLPDCLNKFEKTGAVLNFDLIRDGKLQEKHNGPPWYDGLLYEMIRGCADYLAARRDPALEQRLDGYIERIVAAQAKDPNGYVNTYTQMVEPTHRFGLNGGDDNKQHDVYNAGAMIEAGVHYYRATGKTTLLKAAVRFANHLCDLIGPPPRNNVIPGHALPEEAVARLYELFHEQPGLKKEMGFPIDEERYLALAEFFIEARGHHEGRKSFDAYGQDHEPVFQQQTIEGHVVRATLMGTGVAALAAINGREEYQVAARRLWENMTGKRMHLTGGVGARAKQEAFGSDYELPNDGYLETCAATGSGFFSRNMNLLSGDARYADELERTLYNAVLAGVSVKGDSYFYTNPLEANKARTRWKWSGCPCCPPMFLKIMGALPGYLYAQDSTGVYVNLFAGSQARVHLPVGEVVLRQTTRYPWQGEVKFVVEPENPAQFDLYFRIPAWCQGVSSADDLYRAAGRPASGAARLKINGQLVEQPEIVRGYAHVRREWKSGDVVELTLDMPVRRVKTHPKAEADVNRVAFMRGPIVYCVEGCDTDGNVRNLFVPPAADLAAKHCNDLLGGVTILRGSAVALCRTENGNVEQIPVQLTAVPYAANANRGPVEMAVWLPEIAALAQPQPLPTIASRARPSVSHCCPKDSPGAMNDQIEPAASDDTKIPRFTWWNHCGTTEWAQYDFDQPQKVSSVEVYWWDERRIKQHCRVPASWRLLHKEGGDWKPVSGVSEYGAEMDRFNRVTFTPVTTSALRIEAQLQPNWSGGILEWKAQ